MWTHSHDQLHGMLHFAIRPVAEGLHRAGCTATSHTSDFKVNNTVLLGRKTRHPSWIINKDIFSSSRYGTL